MVSFVVGANRKAAPARGARSALPQGLSRGQGGEVSPASGAERCAAFSFAVIWQKDIASKCLLLSFIP